MQNICLLSKDHGMRNNWGKVPPSIKIPYAELQIMDRVVVEKYINGHKNTAILRAASTQAKQQYPDVVAIVSYFDRSNMKIIHNPLLSSQGKAIIKAGQDNFHTEDLPGFGSYITNIIADNPSTRIVILSSNPKLPYNETQIGALDDLYNIIMKDGATGTIKELLPEYVWEHRHIAILYDPPQKTKESLMVHPGNRVIAALSYYNPYTNRVANKILQYPSDFQDVNYRDGSMILSYNADMKYANGTDAGFQNITSIISDIPMDYKPPSYRREDLSELFNPSLQGGKRKKRNTYKKRHARRRKTQYRRR